MPIPANIQGEAGLGSEQTYLVEDAAYCRGPLKVQNYHMIYNP